MTPSLAMGRDGTPYVLYVANDESRRLWCTFSKNGGEKWELHQIANESSSLPPALAIDWNSYAIALVRDKGTGGKQLTHCSSFRT